MNLLTKKDIVALNTEAGELGEFSNEGSLDFALSIAKTKKNMLYELSYLVRSILVDHVFNDGNKRTALLVINYYLEDQKYRFQREDLLVLVKKIAERNITSPVRIMRMIYHVIEKKDTRIS